MPCYECVVYRKECVLMANINMFTMNLTCHNSVYYMISYLHLSMYAYFCYTNALEIKNKTMYVCIRATAYTI